MDIHRGEKQQLPSRTVISQFPLCRNSSFTPEPFSQWGDEGCRAFSEREKRNEVAEGTKIDGVKRRELRRFSPITTKLSRARARFLEERRAVTSTMARLFLDYGSKVCTSNAEQRVLRRIFDCEGERSIVIFAKNTASRKLKLLQT